MPLAAALLPAGTARSRPGGHRAQGRRQLRAGVVARACGRARDLSYLRLLRVDAVSAVFLLATGFLYAAIAVYSVGYLRRRPRQSAARPGTARFWIGLNLFAWAMLVAPMMSNLALLWVAIEVTTVVSALLVAIEDSDGAGGGGVEVRAARLGRAGPGTAGDDLHLLRRRAGPRPVLRPRVHPVAGGRAAAAAHRGPARRSSWPCSATAPRWAWCRCTPGCRTRTRRRRRRCRRCCPGRCWRSASTRSCAITR